MPSHKITAAAVHAAPVYMNKTATLSKVCSLIASASSQAITLLGFPEVFVPGFPYFINTHAPSAPAVAAYANASVLIPDDLRDVQAACAKHGMTIVLGVSERMRSPAGTSFRDKKEDGLGGGNTCFNSLVTIDSDGTILGVHRKLQPTWAERYVWGQGSGHTLKTYPTLAGYRLGGLACWEHTMNNARQALIQQGEHVHVGCWPAMNTSEGFEGTATLQVEALMKAHALTGQVFVLCATGYVTPNVLEWIKENLGETDKVKVGGGWSAVVHPMCNVIAGPEEGMEDVFVKAELNLSELDIVRAFVDGTGHFSRPEVFRLSVDASPRWGMMRILLGRSRLKGGRSKWEGDEVVYMRFVFVYKASDPIFC